MGTGREIEAAEALKHTPMNLMMYPSMFHSTLQKCYCKQGQYDRAEKVIKNALEVEPENKYGQALLGLARQMQGNPVDNTLNDYDNIVREYNIEVPEGFDRVNSSVSN